MSADASAKMDVVPRSRGFSMRWWLAAAFAGVAALTAVAVVAVMNSRSESALRAHGADLAVGSTVAAAEDLKGAPTRTALQARAVRIAETRQVAVFVLDAKGRLLTGKVSHGESWAALPHHLEAVRTVLGGQRFIGGSRDGSALTVALHVHGGVGAMVVTFTLRPELAAQLGIVRNEGPRSALVAFALAAAAGLVDRDPDQPPAGGDRAPRACDRRGRLLRAARRRVPGRGRQPLAVDRRDAAPARRVLPRARGGAPPARAAPRAADGRRDSRRPRPDGRVRERPGARLRHAGPAARRGRRSRTSPRSSSRPRRRSSRRRP